MERPVLVAVVIRSDGSRISVPVSPGRSEPTLLERISALLRRFLGAWPSGA